jgi:hypothetical protein
LNGLTPAHLKSKSEIKRRMILCLISSKEEYSHRKASQKT